ncbi:transposase [Xenorhabdus miraniensis]|uniref:transposase n=1 Tax=Xenorhabdus miraniensis TaxID=351674 RepID=UPI000C039A81
MWESSQQALVRAYSPAEWGKRMLSKHFIIEMINGKLKTISQIKHSRHQSIKGFLSTVSGGLIVYLYEAVI